MKTFLILFSSFFGSVGDTVFLVGIPLYLFQTFHASFFASTAVSLAITITVLVARKYIVDINQKDPVLITCVGEITMGLVEIALLGFYLFVNPSPWTIIFGTVPLALVYNSYAASKFLRIQERLFLTHILLFTTVQSGLVRVGSLLGVGLAGWLVLTHGLSSVLLLDAGSFLLSGLVLSLFVKQGGQAAVLEGQACTKGVSEVFVQELDIKATHFCLGLVFLGLLFLSWEQASSIATVSVVSGFTIAECSIMRGVLGALGVLVSIALVHLRPQWMIFSWKVALGALILSGGLLAFPSPVIASGILLFIGAFVGSIQVPVQRHIYKAAERLSLYSKPLSAQQMTLRSALTITLPILGIGLDHLPIPHAGILPLTFGFIFIVGTFGGVFLKRSFV